MAEAAVLDLNLAHRDENRYYLNFRFRLPDNISETNLGVRAGLEAGLDTAGLRALSANMDAYGRRLAEQIFSDPQARSALAQARSISEAAGLALHVRLAIVPAQDELSALRWEALYDPNRSTPLFTGENVRLSRYVSANSARVFARPELDRLRAVVCVANPARLQQDYGLSPVDVAGEIERARKGLGEVETVILDSSGKATLDGLVEAVRRGCNLVYLVAHGGFGKGSPLVYLEKEDGSPAATPADELVRRLSELAGLPLLAVLVSCQSAGNGADGSPHVALGPRLAAAGIPAVIAMQGSVSYQSMTRFVPVFLGELMKDGQIDRAIAVARAAVHDRPDWWMPVLFSHLSDNRLFTPSLPWRVQSFEPETAPVPAGKFWMGRDPGMGVAPWECPRHQVDLPAYRIGRYPVTNRQYAEFVRQTGQTANPEMGWDGQTPPAGRLDDPVSGVTWFQALAYCAWLSQKTGRSYTLPNEAQWEKAARGEQGWLYPWGDAWQDGRANTCAEQITPVNSFPAQTPYGCYDMVGNVREWTLSLWGDKRSEPDPAYGYPWADDGRNDPAANEQIRRIFRGGIQEKVEEMTCAARESYVPNKSGPPGKRHGFRVVING